ncbi:MAG: hypothetical protein HYT42_01140 [Candidatus Sungbacteria bacterium]|nr:hypothetical protein [Candidatus Sungbacteria bacterium]
MIYFLYGADTYRSRGKLNEIIREFRKRGGESLAVTRIDAEDHPESVFLTGRTASLFSLKELVVIENISRSEEKLKKHIAGRLADWRKDKNITVVFWEGEVDADKDILAEAIKKLAKKAQEFRLLTGRALEAWIDEEAAKRGAKLSLKERELLAGRYSSDLWVIVQELDKISSGWALAVEKDSEEKIWNLADAFLKSRRQGFYPLMKLLASGEDPIYLAGAFAASLRTLALVYQSSADCKLKKAAGKLAPFVLKKNIELARQTDVSKIRRLFSDLIRADVALKTGQPPAPLPLVKLVLEKS